MWGQKERERGFNQAEMIGKLVAREWGLKYIPMLSRVRATPPMYGLNRRQRKENVEGAFKINSPITNSQMCTNWGTVILVDDVWTTGATMRECARVLKRVGVKEVWGLTLAR